MRYLLRKGFGKWVPCFALGISLAAVGCGSSTGTISGKVSYKGAPLKGGYVTFYTKDKKVTRPGEIQEDGSYKIEKMPTGEALICVDTSTLKPPTQAHNIPTYSPPKGQQLPPRYKLSNNEEKAKRYVEIPSQYADPDKSKLTYTVKGGSQEYDIKLP